MQTDPQETETLEQLRDKLSLMEVAMVAYQALDGEIRSEPLQTARMDREGNLWFFVGTPQPLVAAIARNPQINLVYVNQKEGLYLSVGGTANLLRNRHLQEALWSSKLKRWFSSPLDEHAALLKVAPQYGEYWDEPRSNMFRMLLKAVDAAEGDKVGLTHRRIPIETAVGRDMHREAFR